ncbi:tumor necrosis factor b (TNF superfamily, member 2) [Kryptolebias marmoratus]|uniref:tumor necrosis factor b (TNF superfamily, member 2) n=1 Tax=Kryptolebias marmoratus TaxID=37003 RepID=UPI0007F93320|nr:tumor necrosis factor b (TNF superfamily, member 2) [Kryptolebias marmoratus]
MMGYAAADGDLEAAAQDRTHVLVEKKSSTGWMWKVLGALVLLALCAGGVRLGLWFWTERAAPTQIHSVPPAPQSFPNPEEKTGSHSTLKQILKTAKAAIHLEASYKGRGNAKLEWSDNMGQAFAQGGLRLHLNQIIIPETGLYFIYSQASFRVSCSDEAWAERRSTPLSHRIWRFSDSIGSQVSLMSAVRSACQNVPEEGSKSGERCYSAIYLGAVFHLKTGDQLWTETNQLSELETEEGKTFFGAFAL